MPSLATIIETIGLALELVGVAVIVAGAFYATWRCWRLRDQPHVFGRYRLDLGRALLLGLEFLVAGDIIRTVIIEPSLESVAILAVVVLVRTMLGVALAFELAGRGPWRRPEPNSAIAGPQDQGSGQAPVVRPEAGVAPRDLSSP